MQLTELLPHVAKVTDKLAIIRSMTHNDPDHTAGYHVMMTGQHPGTGPAFNRNVSNNNVHPSFGSMVAKLGPERRPAALHFAAEFPQQRRPGVSGGELRSRS